MTNKPSEAAPFSSEEWKTLQFAPLWVFGAVAAADGKIDEKEFGSLVGDIGQAALFSSKVLRAALISLSDDFENVFDEFRTDTRSVVDGLGEVRKVIESKLSAEDANLFKGGLLIVGRNVGMASGGFLGVGDPFSNDEKTALGTVAMLLNFSI